jgi:hypothetical protein
VADGLVATVAVVMWCAVAYQVPRLRRSPGDPALRVLLVALAAVATAATFFVQRFQRAVHTDPAEANVVDLAARLSVLVAAWAAVALLRYLTQPQEEARRVNRHELRWLVLVGLVVTAFWSAAVGDLGGGAGQVGSPWSTPYMAVYLAYLGVSLVKVVHGALRYAAPAGGSLALGLRLVAIGCGWGLGYIVCKLIITVTLADPSRAVRAVPITMAVLAGAFVASGATLPSLVPVAASWRRHLSVYVAHWKLFPLWSALREVDPGIALDPAPSRLADALRVRDLEFRLSRRVIEIRDGRLALRPFLDAEVAESAGASAAGPGAPADPEAVAEAAALSAALDSHRSGARPARHWLGAGGGGEDLHTETQWLLEVAAAYRRCHGSKATRAGERRRSDVRMVP